MLTGPGCLQGTGCFPRHAEQRMIKNGTAGDIVPCDVFNRIARAERDTLLFLYGVVMCVGGTGLPGYLAMTSNVRRSHWGPTTANAGFGVLLSVGDNIPVMFGVLTMNTGMSSGQWLPVTMTAGVGGRRCRPAMPPASCSTCGSMAPASDRRNG
jgi:Na+/H+ antiporter NhaD/arsenite permease-like protein